MQDSESGRAHAREEMFRLYGREYGANSTRLMEDGMAVLYYQAFPDHSAAATLSALLDQLTGVTSGDMDAIFGMVMGYLRRDQRRQKKAASGK